MKKMTTSAMKQANGGKKRNYFCDWCGKNIYTTSFGFMIHRATKHWFK